ncbi:MAG: hypothetical protein HYR66_02295 [Sphingobacteriales bacterium]|nr:hypothetical protein [Sphingobacteriales bacterium]MBI3717082.1 hypothetical protein [Sphingobacteriales bacterium]
MNRITIYKVFTFILIPFATIFGLLAILMLLVALANPVLLLPLFMMVGFTIYTGCSSIFLFKGIINNQALKPSLKDWTKVNGYVSSAMGVMTLINTITLMNTSKAELRKYAKQMLAMQTTKPAGFDADSFIKMMSAMSWGLLAFAIILIIHLLYTFTFLKKYQHLFGNPQQ